MKRDAMEKTLAMKGKYAKSWAKYRRFGRYELYAAAAMLVFLILFYPIVFLLKTVWPFELLGAVLFFVAGYFNYCRIVWRCPRCGKPFNGRFGIGGIRECAYCALPKWANNDGDDESTQNENNMRTTR
jgi:hypothetical protein